MTLKDIRRVDPKGMYDWIAGFPEQVEEAIAIGRAFKPSFSSARIRTIVLSGLGGSAIGGDLLRTFLADRMSVPIIVNRNYDLPAFVGKDTLVIISSYSGNTEETISAHRDAIKRRARVLCISTNGKTAQMAARHGQPCISIPPGLSPRAALGYSFFPLLIALRSMGFVKVPESEIRETVALLHKLSKVWKDPRGSKNEPIALAKKVYTKLPVIYSSTEHLDAINVRWKGQINENAKQLAGGHVLPEMNHNELVGWKHLPDLLKRIHVIFLKDAGTHPRVVRREKLTRSWIEPMSGGVTEVRSRGKSTLARMFSLIHFGDWVSLYLAVLNGEDPEPVEAINVLKNALSKVR